MHSLNQHDLSEWDCIHLVLVIKASAVPRQLQLKGTLEKGRVRGGEGDKRDGRKCRTRYIQTPAPWTRTKGSLLSATQRPKNAASTTKMIDLYMLLLID